MVRWNRANDSADIIIMSVYVEENARHARAEVEFLDKRIVYIVFIDIARSGI